MENQNPQPKTQQDIASHALALLTQGKRSWDVKDALTAQGVEKEEAYKLVDTLKDTVNAANKKRGIRDMIFGALWCIGGSIVTIVTYSAASGGGRYVVAWGAIIFGAIQFFQGYSKFSKVIY